MTSGQFAGWKIVLILLLLLRHRSRIHAIFLDKTLSRRPGVKDNDWIIFLEYDAYTFFAFLIRTRNS